METQNRKINPNIFTLLGASFMGLFFIPGVFSWFSFQAFPMFAVVYNAEEIRMNGDNALGDMPAHEIPTHLKTPQAVKAIYMTQCVFGTPEFRTRLLSSIEGTEINSIVIDIKDYTGTIGFGTDNFHLKDNVSKSCAAYDAKEFIDSLHAKGIYMIGRITVFQDPLYTHAHPELAIKKESSTTTIWKDYKGLSFVDAGAEPFWDYIIELSKEAFDLGFDELNYDYIRFPSDGNMQDIYYPWSNDLVMTEWETGKADIVEGFFAHLSKNMRAHTLVSRGEDGVLYKATPILSADLFGMVTTNTDDLNIGQVLERALPYFDYIAPMTYPSHYPAWFNGWENPNHHIYDIVYYSLSHAVERLVSSTTAVITLTGGESLSTTTDIFSKPVYNREVLRPWIQDFDYGGTYGPEEVRAQIKAAYDAGLTSWMLWSPSNEYTIEALENVSHSTSSDDFFIDSE